MSGIAENFRGALSDRWRLTRACLRGRARHEWNWGLTRALRWAYTLKAVACVWLGRWHDRVGGDYDDPVEVGYLGGGRGFDGEYTTYWWEVLVVGYGWGRWWVDERQDSSP